MLQLMHYFLIPNQTELLNQTPNIKHQRHISVHQRRYCNTGNNALGIKRSFITLHFFHSPIRSNISIDQLRYYRTPHKTVLILDVYLNCGLSDENKHRPNLALSFRAVSNTYFH